LLLPRKIARKSTYVRSRIDELSRLSDQKSNILHKVEPFDVVPNVEVAEGQRRLYEFSEMLRQAQLALSHENRFSYLGNPTNWRQKGCLKLCLNRRKIMLHDTIHHISSS